MATIASLNTNFTATTANLEQGTMRAEKALRGFGASAKSLSAAAFPDVGKLIQGAVAGFTLHRVGESIVSQIEQLDSMVDRAVSLQTAPSKLQALEHAGALAGITGEQIDTAMTKLTNKVAEAAAGSESAATVFDRLHLNANRLAALRPDQQIEEVAGALAKMENPTQMVAAAVDLFGTRNAKLIAMLSEGSQFLRVAEGDLDRLGAAVDQLGFAAADVAGDSMVRLDAAIRGLNQSIAVSAAPGLKLFNDALAETIAASKKGVLSQFALSLAYLETQKAAGNVIQAAEGRGLQVWATLQEGAAAVQRFLGMPDMAAGQERTAEQARKTAEEFLGIANAADVLNDEWKMIFNMMEESTKKQQKLAEISQALAAQAVQPHKTERAGRMVDRKAVVPRQVEGTAALEKGAAATVDAINKVFGGQSKRDEIERNQLAVLNQMEDWLAELVRSVRNNVLEPLDLLGP